MLACGWWTKRLCSLNNIFYLYILICILVYCSVTLIFCITIRAEFALQQTWLLPVQPLSEEAQLWEMQKRGISLAGGHELFQLYHLLGVHSATLLPLPSLWIGWWGGEHKAHKTMTALTSTSLRSIRNPANVSACSAPTPDMLTCDDWIRMRHSERLTLFASHTFVSTFRSGNAFQPQCAKCLYSKLHDSELSRNAHLSVKW